MSDEKINDDVETGVPEPEEDCGCGCGAGAAGVTTGQKLWKTLFFVAVVGSALAVAAHAYINRQQAATGSAACGAAPGEATCGSAGCTEKDAAALTCPSGFDSTAMDAASMEGSGAKGVCPITAQDGDGCAEGSAAKGACPKTTSGGECCPEGSAAKGVCPKTSA